MRLTQFTVLGPAAILLSVGLLVSAGTAPAEPVSMTPFKIVLNAKGQSEDFQAIVSMNLVGGSRVIDFDITLWFNEFEIEKAKSAFYCVIDDNLLVGFDRTSVLANPDVAALAGQPVVATVEGWIAIEAYDGGAPIIRSFSGTDDVEIVNPGR